MLTELVHENVPGDGGVVVSTMVDRRFAVVHLIHLLPRYRRNWTNYCSQRELQALADVVAWVADDVRYKGGTVDHMRWETRSLSCVDTHRLIRRAFSEDMRCVDTQQQI